MRAGYSLILFALALFQLPLSSQEAERKFAFDNYKRYYSEARAVRDAEKEAALPALRDYFVEHPQVLSLDKPESEVRSYLDHLLDDGSFSDMNAEERRLRKGNIYSSAFRDTHRDDVGLFLGKAYRRVFHIASAYRTGLFSGEVPERLFKAILHYGGIELGRFNNMPRFHASCFAIPTAAVNSYFALLPYMDKAERGEAGPLVTEACDMLKAVALEAWTQPLRRDETDLNVVSIERFRNHVWWVGGNAIGYRQLLPIAVMYRSIPMIDLLAEIYTKCLSTTSQTTIKDSFWTEGFTADGAGWGHGRQCLVWGYPIDGAFSALRMLTILKDTPWAESLSKESTAVLMNFFRGAGWYYYKGFRLPGIDRNSYVWNPDEKPIPYKKMLDNVIENWFTSFSEQERAELLELRRQVAARRIDMEDTPYGEYRGMRWFFNNDDLMKKTPDCHVTVNMASNRCDGLESSLMADNYNFYPADGATLFQRSGDEYFKVMGGWDVTFMPGVTSREGMDRLTPVTNWQGYCSRENFAGAATDRCDNGVAGFLFEKMNGKWKVNPASFDPKENEILYGFSASKGYFFLGDYFVALGAGVTEKRPDLPGHIHTSIEQTWNGSQVSVSRGRSVQPLGKGVKVFESDGKKPFWIVQEGKFSYTILPEYSKEVCVALETKPAEWVKRNPDNRPLQGLPDSVDILRIWIDHGEAPVDEKYGYAVYLGSGVPTGKLPFEVLRNDTAVQAVRSKDVVEAVFYDSEAELTAKGLSLKVSAPSVLMLSDTGKEGLRLYVTDALMNPSLNEIVVTLNGVPHTVSLPQGELCGSVAELQIGDRSL